MRPITVLVAALALALAGCGAQKETNTAPAESPGAPSARPAGTKDSKTVIMKEIEFAPKNIDVKVGDTVKWVNQDPVEHNVVAMEGADFESPLFDQQGMYRYKVTKAGVIRYECTVHPGMEATITVK